jgi:hypothetical protein
VGVEPQSLYYASKGKPKNENHSLHQGILDSKEMKDFQERTGEEVFVKNTPEEEPIGRILPEQ